MTVEGKNNKRLLKLVASTAASAAMLQLTRRVWMSGNGVKVPAVDGLQSPPPGDGEWPFVSIIVPARNEERNLPGLLPGLLSQRYPSYEVIVVDDQSDDATPQILEEWSKRDSTLKVVKGKELPRDQGWLGKPHAMFQGAAVARGEWLLFTDADTRHEPLALSSTVAFALSHNADLFSILPCYDLVTPAERLVMPVAFMGIMWLYPTDKVNDPASPEAIANGQYLLVRRAVYDAVGGAERVKGQIVEDLEFAKAVKHDGFRLFLADGRSFMNVRMYTSLAEIWHGWSKNVVIAMRDNPATIPLALSGLFLGLVMPFLVGRWVLNAWRIALNERGTGPDKLAAAWITMLASVNLGAYLSARRRVDKELGLPAGWALTQPIGGAVLAAIMLYSLGRLVTGKGLVWKGRVYHES